MSEWTMQSISGNPQILSERLGAFLRREVSAKQLSRLIDCDQRTAENLRGGKTWPIARHMLGLWIAFGADVLEAVFYPERVEARLKGEAKARDQARQLRIASASLSMASDDFRVGDGLGEAAGSDEEPAELGPPNLDLFEEASL